MTWASASGGGGEKIGEVRMFVGEVPEGWEAFQNVLPLSSSLPSLQWLASVVAADNGVTSGNAGPQRGLAFCGGQHIMQMGNLSNPLSDNPTSRPIRIIDIVTQTITELQSLAIASPAAYESLPGGKVLFCGGVRVANSGPVSTTQLIDRFGVVTTVAPMPSVRFRSTSGKISDDQILVIGGTTGSPMSPGTATNTVFKYTVSSNTWATLPNFPVTPSIERIGAVATVNSRTITIVSNSIYEMDNSTETFSLSGISLPEGVTDPIFTQAGYLKDGRALFYGRYTKDSVVSQPGLFIYDGVSIELIDTPPIGTRTATSIYNHCVVSTPIDIGADRVIAIANNPGNSSYGGAILADESQAFIMQNAIKYARKLQ